MKTKKAKSTLAAKHRDLQSQHRTLQQRMLDSINTCGALSARLSITESRVKALAVENVNMQLQLQRIYELVKVQNKNPETTFDQIRILTDRWGGSLVVHDPLGDQR